MPNSIYDDWGLDFGSLEVQDLISRYADNDDSISINRDNRGTMYCPMPTYDKVVIIDKDSFKPKGQYYISIDDNREMQNQIEILKSIIRKARWIIDIYKDMEYHTVSRHLIFDICIREALGKGLSTNWSGSSVICNMNELFNLYKYYKIINNIYTYFSKYHQDWKLISNDNKLEVVKGRRKVMTLRFESSVEYGYQEMKMQIYFKEYLYNPPSNTIIFASTGSHELEDISGFLKYFDKLILEGINNGN